MTALAFVFAFVLCAKADGGVAGFTTGTSFENHPVGPFDPNRPDRPGESVVYWAAAEATDRAVVTNYVEGVSPAYDYSARKMERGVGNYFGNEPEDEAPHGTNHVYLAVDLDTPLERLAMPRLDGGGISNVLLKVADAYDGIYADTLVKLTPSIAAPDIVGEDKIVVWMRESECGVNATVTNLVVTAGYYDGSFDNVRSVDYVVESPTVSADTWCRLTVCAISDITGVQKSSGRIMSNKVPGFVVYLDGTQAVANASYSIGRDYPSEWLTPAARVLVGERGLFPWLVRRGSNSAMTLSRLAFAGQGAVDDILFTTTRPGHVEADNTFTLKWDSGIAAMRCIVSNAMGVATNEIDAAKKPRYWDCRFGTNVNTVVTVTNVLYSSGGYTNGVWSAESSCSLLGNSFVCSGTNPVGRVASSRDVVVVGGEEGYETFAEAKARAKTRNPIVLKLATNMVVTIGGFGDPYKDGGMFSVTNGDDIVLDLMGHTLQGSNVNYTVSQNGGKLRIIDSEGGGAVLPPPGKTIAVRSVSKSQDASKGLDTNLVLAVEAGRYAGKIDLTVAVNRNKYSYCGVCVIDGGSFTNLSDEASFYLQSCVTNTSLYFGLDANNYWTPAAEGFIWCGQGSNDLWTTAGNWKGGVVPGPGDLAIFPPNTNDVDNCWTVDFGAGVGTTSFWLDADIRMLGTNEFSNVNVISGKGRLVGEGTATFTGVLPDRLYSDGEGSGKIRIGAGWEGTVKISGLTSKAQILRDVTWWGVAGSKVEFAGVRGYLSDTADYAVPYELVLTDAPDGSPAWKNDTGYTGSIVSFQRLSGTGSFVSPKNLREILQVFHFKDVRDFTGRFDLGGKRLLLGKGSPALASKAGHFTFANDVGVRSGLDWSGVSAHFGTNLVVYGELGQRLMSYSSKVAPAVGGVSVDLHSATTNRTCVLVAENGQIVVASGEQATAGGMTYMIENLADNLKAGETFVVPAGSAVTIIDGNRVIINGVDATFASYYVVRQVDGSTYSVQFDEDEATPTLAEFTVSKEDGKVTVRVENAKADLWYGLQTTSSLGEDWQGPGSAGWKKLVGDTLTFEQDLPDASGFFRVVVTDRDPNGGAK